MCNICNIFKITINSKLIFSSIPCILIKLIHDTRVRKKKNIMKVSYSLERKGKKNLSLQVEVKLD